MSLVSDLAYATWRPLGPAPVSAPPDVSHGRVCGRMVCLAMHPTDMNIAYAASDSGGIWRTTSWLEAAPDWSPLTDEQATLNMGASSNAYHALLLHPMNPSFVFAGCGRGLLKSVNGGGNWDLLGAGVLDQGAGVGSVAVDPTDETLQTVYVSVWPQSGQEDGRCGIFKSSNGGSTWSKLQPPGAETCGATDVVVARYDSSVLFAGFVGSADSNQAASGVYWSKNGGSTWAPLSNGIDAGNAIGGPHAGIILDTSTVAGHAYVAYLKQTSSNPQQAVVYRAATIDGGNSWQKLPPTITSPQVGTPEWRSWHLLLAVDPDNPLIVVVNDSYLLWGAINYAEVAPGDAAAWARIDIPGPGGGGDDYVSGSFSPENDLRMMFTSDQGVYDAGILAGQWQNKSGNLQVTQFYNVTPDPADTDVIYGIAQDHRWALRFEYNPDNVWTYLPSGSEYGTVLADPLHSNVLFVADTKAGVLNRSTDGGNSFSPIFQFSSAIQNVPAIQSVVMDPSNSSRIIVGVQTPWETTNADATDPTFRPLKAALPEVPGSAIFSITSMAIAPSRPAVLYVSTAVTMQPGGNPSTGRIYVTESSGESWSESDSGLPYGTDDGYMTSLVVDPEDWTIAYGVGWFGIWKLFGGTWTAVPGPSNQNVWTVYVDWNSGAIFAGTDIGVYRSENAGQSWSRAGNGLPNVWVKDLKPIGDAGLCAATWGRGLWATRL